MIRLRVDQSLIDIHYLTKLQQSICYVTVRKHRGIVIQFDWVLTPIYFNNSL